MIAGSVRRRMRAIGRWCGKAGPAVIDPPPSFAIVPAARKGPLWRNW